MTTNPYYVTIFFTAQVTQGGEQTNMLPREGQGLSKFNPKKSKIKSDQFKPTLASFKSEITCFEIFWLDQPLSTEHLKQNMALEN